MKKLYKHEALEWSNLFFLIPFIISISYGIYWYSIIIIIVFIISFDFHKFYEAKEVYYLDTMFSSFLMISNLYLLFKGHLALPYSILAILCAFCALLFYLRKSKSNYYFNHSLWHIFSAGVCIFCLITFLTFI